MAGDDFIFNAAKGRVRTLSELTGNRRLVWVLLQSTGLEADSVLEDYDTLAALLAASNTEATFTNYVRTAVASPSGSVDDAADEWVLDAAPLQILAAGQGLDNTLHKALICHDPDHTTGTDADLIPVAAYNINVTTDGSDLTFTPSTTGLYAAT
jgi:hypothetical protein